MKIAAILACAIATLVAACGGGSSTVPTTIMISDSSSQAPQMDGQPDIVDPGAGAIPVPNTPDGMNEEPTVGAMGDQAGDLASLYGLLSFGYTYYEIDSPTDALFTLAVAFTSDNFQRLDAETPALVGTSQIELRLAPEEQPVVGNTKNLYCISTELTDQFQCVFDEGGHDQSVFIFGTPSVSNVVAGRWEYCRDQDLDECTTEVFDSPDGDVAVTLRPLPASTEGSTKPSEVVPTDITPYLQYLEQGSNTRAQTSGYNRELFDTLAEAANAR